MGSDTEEEENDEIVLYQPKKLTVAQKQENLNTHDIIEPLEKAHASLTRISESRVSGKVMKIITVPRAHIKALTTPEKKGVEQLKIFYVPPRKGRDERGIFFYKAGMQTTTPTHGLIDQCRFYWSYPPIWNNL